MCIRDRRRDERKNLNPVSALQPSDRSIKYDNIRSARAEEGVIRLALMDEAVLDCGLEKDEFSSPLLGKVFQALKNRHLEGLDVSISALSGILNAEEMSHITLVADKPESAENITKALNDYIEIIRDRQSGDIDLLELREKYREKKGYGG